MDGFEISSYMTESIRSQNLLSGVVSNVIFCETPSNQSQIILASQITIWANNSWVEQKKDEEETGAKDFELGFQVWTPRNSK